MSERESNDSTHSSDGRDPTVPPVDRATDPAARRRRLGETAGTRRTGIGVNLENRQFETHGANGDPELLGPVGAFTKGIERDPGGETPGESADEISAERFRAFVAALRAEDHEALQGLTNERALVNPTAAGSSTMLGRDPNDAAIDPAPKLLGDRTAAEMVELYWQAVLRDVEFGEYTEDERAREAAAELDDLAGTAGENGRFRVLPPDGPDEVRPDRLFRGTLPGAATGPYVSQFLYRPIPRGARLRDQRLRVFEPGENFMTERDEWRRVQNGVAIGTSTNLEAPTGSPFAASDPDPGVETDGVFEAQSRTEDRRFITTGRDLATYVRANTSQQPYLAAALILQGLNAPLDPGNPFQAPNESGGEEARPPDLARSFVDYGRTEYQTAIVAVIDAAIHAAWYQKWLVHLRPRPEEYGGLVNRVVDGESDLAVPETLLESAGFATSREAFDTPLLPQAYAVGSPTHPSYPAGHAVNAGACATVLKAFFDTDVTFDELADVSGRERSTEKVLPRPTEDGGDGPDRELRFADEIEGDPQDIRAELTVGGEINKLATNLSIGRNWAGIHYRTDATAGYELGETIAVAYLRDRLRTRSVSGRLTVPTFDGDEVVIEA